jgi:hypothetical protein
VREDDPSPPVGERPVDDGIRRFDVCSWAFVYRKEVDENTDYPRRSGIRALDKPSLKNLGWGSSIRIWMRPNMQRDLALLCELDVRARRISHDRSPANRIQ